MVTLRPMLLDDLLHFNSVNLDFFTETFNLNFYFRYLNKWPECCAVAESLDGAIVGYVIGKVEGQAALRHGHVSALTVAPECRRTCVAQTLMQHLEEVSDEAHGCHFVDLFVRPSNKAAIRFYKSLGYVFYRAVANYYSGPVRESAIEMRKPLRRDVQKRSISSAAKEPKKL